MAKIGIFGGAFNPVHKGHVSLAKQMQRAAQLDRVLVIPSSHPPHKTVVSLEPDEKRYAMCKLAFEGDPNFEVSSIELERGGQSYTIETLRHLRNLYPQDVFYLILGSDMIYSFELWKDYKQILKQAILLTGAREKNEYKIMKEKAAELIRLGGDVRVVPIKAQPISSTKIRMMLSQNMDVSHYLDRKVMAYIRHEKLYQNRGMNSILNEVKPIVKAKLSKTRYMHTKCVAEQAKLLARRYSIDEEIACLGGYLHDIMKCKPKGETLRYLQDNGILLTDIEKMIPATWHAIAGAVYCKRELGIESAQIINAVRYHTTGRKYMTLLEKIVFVADATGEDREYKNVEEIREKSFKNLDAAVWSCLCQNLSFLTEIGRPIHPDSVEAYNALLKEKMEERNGRRYFS